MAKAQGIKKLISEVAPIATVADFFSPGYKMWPHKKIILKKT